MDDSEFDEMRATAKGRLASLERLNALYRLREQAREANRAAMLKSIEDLIRLERKALRRDTDPELARHAGRPACRT